MLEYKINRVDRTCFVYIWDEDTKITLIDKALGYDELEILAEDLIDIYHKLATCINQIDDLD